MKVSHDDLVDFVPCLQQAGPKVLLHVGCGTANPKRMPEIFQGSDWNEIRLDIDPGVQPDIVADVADMNMVPAGRVDAVWSCHNLEHLDTYAVPAALQEMRRVLKPGGFLLLHTPDLETLAQLVVQGKLETVMYESPAGPITPLDMLFGHGRSLEQGNHYMAHRTGFTQERLGRLLLEAGFAEARVLRGNSYDLWAVAVNAKEKPGSDHAFMKPGSDPGSLCGSDPGSLTTVL